MATDVDISVRVPAKLIAEARTWAERDAMPIDQFIRHAIEEKIAAQGMAYLAARAARGSREDFAHLLAKAGTEQPRPGDEIPQGWLPEG